MAAVIRECSGRRAVLVVTLELLIFVFFVDTWLVVGGGVLSGAVRDRDCWLLGHSRLGAIPSKNCCLVLRLGGSRRKYLNNRSFGHDTSSIVFNL